MTETLTSPEAPPAVLGPLLEGWVESPPPSLSEALLERGVDAEALENYARSGIGAEEAENLRKVLIQGATSGKPEDASLLHRLTPVLDPRERAWDRVLRAKNTGEIITATVTEATRGGVVVDLGVRGFVPASQIGLSVPRNLTQYVGRPLKLRVVEVNRARQTVILSNRDVMQEDRAEKRRAAISRLQEGEERSGTVRRLTDIGAFVDVGGVDGLLHVSEISWQRVEHPQDVLKVGQKVNVKILRVDPGQGRVSLSMRRLVADPWDEARRKYMAGMTLHVKVTRIVPQGAVVEMEGGLEGFLPISEMAHRRINSPEEVVQVGQELDALLAEFQPRDRRIVFSLRKLEQKRERTVVENYQRRPKTTSERTTLGDLFGHLFEEYQQPEDEAAARAAAATAPAAQDEDRDAAEQAAALAGPESLPQAPTEHGTSDLDQPVRAEMSAPAASDGGEPDARPHTSGLIAEELGPQVEALGPEVQELGPEIQTTPSEDRDSGVGSEDFGAETRGAGQLLSTEEGSGAVLAALDEERDEPAAESLSAVGSAEAGTTGAQEPDPAGEEAPVGEETAAAQGDAPRARGRRKAG